jgi:chromosomal replication initiator protein
MTILEIETVLSEQITKVNMSDLTTIILELSVDYFKITLEQLKSKNRKRKLVDVRQMTAIILLKFIPESSLKSIGRCFGGRDHSTVIHYKKNHLNYMETSKPYKRDFEMYERFIKESIN